MTQAPGDPNVTASLKVLFSLTSNHQPSEENLPRTGWWRRSSHMIVGLFTMIFLTQHNNVWHPESLYGVLWLQPTSKVNGGNPGSRLRWSMPTWWTTTQSDNLVSPYHDNSGLSWTVSAPVKVIAEPAERHGVLQTLISAPVVRPKRCPTSSNPALLQSWTVVCLSFTLLMMQLYCLADQLWVLIAYTGRRRRIKKRHFDKKNRLWYFRLTAKETMMNILQTLFPN